MLLNPETSGYKSWNSDQSSTSETIQLGDSFSGPMKSVLLVSLT